MNRDHTFEPMNEKSEGIEHLSTGDQVTIIKLDVNRVETWRYQGKLIQTGHNCLTLEAYFDRQDMHFQGMFLGRGDRFVETYYSDRWYNVFEIHAREDERLRGWYCNISTPVEVNGKTISYVDLALDLLVFPDYRQLVLDEQEFAELKLSPHVRKKALEALQELQAWFHKNQGSYQ